MLRFRFCNIAFAETAPALRPADTSKAHVVPGAHPTPDLRSVPRIDAAPRREDRNHQEYEFIGGIFRRQLLQQPIEFAVLRQHAFKLPDRALIERRLLDKRPKFLTHSVSTDPRKCLAAIGTVFYSVNYAN